VIEALPQILSTEDDEISKLARARFERKGIRIQTGARVTSTKYAPDGRRVATVESGGISEELAADAIIVAAGVQGNVENLGLEELGVRLDRGSIAVGDCGRTSVPACMRSATSPAL
jgi:dihydrolipoamide dehydrogenase